MMELEVVVDVMNGVFIYEKIIYKFYVIIIFEFMV